MSETAIARAQPRTLYDLGEEFARLELALWESGGEVDQSVEEAFAALGELEGKKVDAYCALARGLDRYADAVRAERDALTAKLRAAENSIARLKERMKDYLEGRGVQEIRGSVFRATLQKHGGLRALTLLVEPESLPREFTRITVEADKEKLRALAELNSASEEEIELTVAGTVVARLEQRGTGVRFR